MSADDQIPMGAPNRSLFLAALRPVTFRDRLRHLLFGCWPEPRPMLGSHVWGGRHCPVCKRYPVGNWRLPNVRKEDWDR